MCLYPLTIKGKTFACGRCLECKIKKSNEWAFRIMIEASQYEHNAFITLTYDEEHLPQGGNLSRRDLTLFLKRLRSKFGKLRYFACGEYGSKFSRPHYHLIVFGLQLDDLKYFGRDKKGSLLYRSAELEKVWTLGFSSVADLTLQTAKYCAKYLQKNHGINKEVKPFTTMSLKPGIGANGFNIDNYLTDKIYRDGKYIKIPRYFDKLLEKSLPTYYEEIKKQRKIKNEKYKLLMHSDEYDDRADKHRKKLFEIFGYTIDK